MRRSKSPLSISQDNKFFRSSEGCGTVLRFFRAAIATGHSGGTLADHLFGTSRILKHWGAASDVTIAGLIHSAYSTQYFKGGVCDASERRKMRQAFGSDAEHLAHLFCILDRRALWANRDLHNDEETVVAASHSGDGKVDLSSEDLKKLATIEIANYVEQAYDAQGMPVPWMAWVLSHIEVIDAQSLLSRTQRVRITENGEALAADRYASFVRDGLVSEDLLGEMLSLNPVSAELQVALAALRMGQGRLSEARLAARRAKHLLEMWGCSWDRRFNFRQWRAAIFKMEALCAKGDREIFFIDAERCATRTLNTLGIL